jgi:hypothetical protein
LPGPRRGRREAHSIWSDEGTDAQHCVLAANLRIGVTASEGDRRGVAWLERRMEFF